MTSEFKCKTRFWESREFGEAMNAMLQVLISSKVELDVGMMREV